MSKAKSSSSSSVETQIAKEIRLKTLILIPLIDIYLFNKAVNDYNFIENFSNIKSLDAHHVNQIKKKYIAVINQINAIVNEQAEIFKAADSKSFLTTQKTLTFILGNANVSKFMHLNNFIEMSQNFKFITETDQRLLNDFRNLCEKLRLKNQQNHLLTTDVKEADIQSQATTPIAHKRQVPVTLFGYLTTLIEAKSYLKQKSQDLIKFANIAGIDIQSIIQSSFEQPYIQVLQILLTMRNSENGQIFQIFDPLLAEVILNYNQIIDLQSNYLNPKQQSQCNDMYDWGIYTLRKLEKLSLIEIEYNNLLLQQNFHRSIILIRELKEAYQKQDYKAFKDNISKLLEVLGLIYNSDIPNFFLAEFDILQIYLDNSIKEWSKTKEIADSVKKLEAANKLLSDKNLKQKKKLLPKDETKEFYDFHKKWIIDGGSREKEEIEKINEALKTIDRSEISRLKMTLFLLTLEVEANRNYAHPIMEDGELNALGFALSIVNNYSNILINEQLLKIFNKIFIHFAHEIPVFDDHQIKGVGEVSNGDIQVLITRIYETDNLITSEDIEYKKHQKDFYNKVERIITITQGLTLQKNLNNILATASTSISVSAQKQVEAHLQPASQPQAALVEKIILREKLEKLKLEKINKVESAVTVPIIPDTLDLNDPIFNHDNKKDKRIVSSTLAQIHANDLESSENEDEQAPALVHKEEKLPQAELISPEEAEEFEEVKSKRKFKSPTSQSKPSQVSEIVTAISNEVHSSSFQGDLKQFISNAGAQWALPDIPAKPLREIQQEQGKLNEYLQPRESLKKSQPAKKSAKKHLQYERNDSILDDEPICLPLSTSLTSSWVERIEPRKDVPRKVILSVQKIAKHDIDPENYEERVAQAYNHGVNDAQAYAQSLSRYYYNQGYEQANKRNLLLEETARILLEGLGKKRDQYSPGLIAESDAYWANQTKIQRSMGLIR